MLPLVGIAASLVPELIRLIGGDKTDALATKVSSVVTAAVGTADEAQARVKLADPAVAAQLQTRLAEIALEAQKVQAQAQDQQRQADLEKLKADLADTQGARSLLTTLAEKNNPIAWGAPVVSIIIGIGFFVIMGIAMFGGNGMITPENSNIIYTLVGTMATGFATAISFWLGSSQSSRDKDETVKQLQLSHAEQTRHLVGMVQQQSSAPAAVADPDPAPQPADAASSPPPNNVVPMRPAHASNFTNCLHEVLKLEGGFSNDPHDHGGMTNLGITCRTLANARGVPVDSITEDMMKALKFEEAASIYRSEYWHRLRCDDVPSGVDLMLFHFGVNAGPQTSASLLQKVVGAPCDGLVGPQTCTAVGRAEPTRLIDDLAEAQLTHYRNLQNENYEHGWKNRVEHMRNAAKLMVSPPATVPIAAAA